VPDLNGSFVMWWLAHKFYIQSVLGSASTSANNNMNENNKDRNVEYINTSDNGQ